MVMTGGHGGGVRIVVGHGRRFGRRREMLSGGFEEVPVIIGVIGVSLPSQIFAVIRGAFAFTKEAIVKIFRGRETGFELGVLGGQAGGVFVCRGAAKVEAEGCVYPVEGEGLSFGVVD